MMNKIIQFGVGVYRRIKEYFLWGDIEKKHIQIEREGKKISVRYINHGTFVRETQEKIDRFENKNDDREYLEYCLRLAMKGCNMITIKRDMNNIEFVTTKGKLEFVLFTADSKEKHREYLLILGVLAEMGFVRDTIAKSGWFKLFSLECGYTYSIGKKSGSLCVSADFGKNAKKATAFCRALYKQVYEKSGEKLSFYLY